MASLTKRKNGTWQLMFVDRDGKRRTLYLPGIDKRNASTIKSHVEALVQATITGAAIPNATAQWVADCGDELRGKLAKAGLVDDRHNVTIAEAVDKFIAGKPEASDATVIVWKRAKSKLVEFFGKERSIQSVDTNDAKDFRTWMLNKGLADNTARKMCSVASQVFIDAIERGTIEKNPFASRSIPKTTRPNEGRKLFIDRETIEKVIAQCPDDEWKLIVALSRYAGLRCPSEVFALRWDDINWEKDRILIAKNKTSERVIPFFSELRPYINSAWDRTSHGEFVIVQHRDHSNLGISEPVSRRNWRRSSRFRRFADGWETVPVLPWVTI